MKTESIVSGKNLVKKYKGFTLDIDSLEIPKGFATALIGENGAGKTTLLNMMAGVRMDYKGEFTYFDGKSIEEKGVKNAIGFTAPKEYFFPTWTTAQVKEMNQILFSDFDGQKYDRYMETLDIPVKNVKSIKGLSDGNVIKLMLAGVLSRDTKMLVLDEPASPLDPLMRSRLCDLIRKYIEEGQGEKSVFFSTHNIADMENVTDYAILMEKGRILEQGFVEDLKEKYILVKGENQDYQSCKEYLIGVTKSNYGFEGLCLSENLNRLAGCGITCETPTLPQICIGIMKAHSRIAEI